ncbi:MBL fold metallo-hydrolase [Streptomyces sp. NPDC006274]|uniref:MBL fold metallo-hydrolase n=1 Tax=unclassified Streptomyces TaxID=2593676 RepID=UPI0033B5B885
MHAYVQPDGGWCLNNAGFVSDGGSTLLVDTAATERRARALRAALLATGAPLPRTVVNTHHHGDHTYGNGVFAPEPVVVGHGPVTDPSAYDATERCLRFVAGLAEEGRAKGLTPLETARAADAGDFAGLRESERLVANPHRAYAELGGLPEGSPLDAAAVFADMAAMNGGAPVACHA